MLLEFYSMSSQLVWGTFEFVMVILIVSNRNWANVKIKIPSIMFNDPSQFQFIREIPLVIFQGVTPKTTQKHVTLQLKFYTCHVNEQ